jgi:hypothetical protein
LDECDFFFLFSTGQTLNISRSSIKTSTNLLAASYFNFNSVDLQHELTLGTLGTSCIQMLESFLEKLVKSVQVLCCANRNPEPTIQAVTRAYHLKYRYIYNSLLDIGFGYNHIWDGHLSIMGTQAEHENEVMIAYTHACNLLEGIQNFRRYFSSPC